MLRKLSIVSAAAVVLCLSGCGKKANNPEADNLAMADANAAMADANAAMTDANASTPAAAPMSAQDFANAATSTDAFEIAEGKLALSKSANVDVKAFATKMIAAHTESTAKVKKAAAAAIPAVIPDATLAPAQQAKVDALGKLSGDAFDKQYAVDQIDAHTTALAAMQGYAAAGTVASLKAVAGEIAPVVQTHLDMANKLPQ